MKNEKLDLMLNKVVEFNNPKGDHFKAFLYKGDKGEHEYYFKVIEILKGNMSFNDIIPVKDGDDKFLIIAAKPKLMVITKNSWHYKLMKYVLRSNAPTPKDMQNGCPYFWLVMFSMIVLPFLLLYKVFKWTLLLIPKAIFWVLEQLVISWLDGIDDEIAYDYRFGDNYHNTKIPKTVKIFLKKSDKNFFELYLSEKYGVIDWQDPKYAEKENELRLKWEVWRKNVEKERAKLNAENEKKRDLAYKKKMEHEKKRAESKARWDAKMKPIYDGFDSMGEWFKKTFIVERGRRNIIIKRTKQFIGALITILVLVATFFIINYLALGLMFIADLCIENWFIFAIIGTLVIAAGIIYGLYILVVSIGQNIVDNYKRGKKIWYVEPFIYIIWYPIKYIVLFIVFIIAKIIWIPIRFIFYTCIWTALLWIGIKLGRFLYNVGKGIIGSTGIFGEYFGASYSDYCPGLEWVGFDEDEEN